MATKYGRNILKRFSVNLFNNDYELLVLDGDKYYNIHIIDNKFRDDELNTLKYQEDKECTSLESFDNIRMTNDMVQHALWDKFYGYKNKTYIFDIRAKVDIDDLENF